MIDKYILKGKKAVPCKDLMEWGKWMQTVDRHVANTKIGKVRVSTVFLGLDHGFGLKNPVLFESMIFGGKYDQEQARYKTWEEAELGHKRMCKKVKGGKLA